MVLFLLTACGLGYVCFGFLPVYLEPTSSSLRRVWRWGKSYVHVPASAVSWCTCLCSRKPRGKTGLRTAVYEGIIAGNMQTSSRSLRREAIFQRKLVRAAQLEATLTKGDPRPAVPYHAQSICARAQEKRQLLSTSRTGLMWYHQRGWKTHTAIERARFVLKKGNISILNKSFCTKANKECREVRHILRLDNKGRLPKAHGCGEAELASIARQVRQELSQQSLVGPSRPLPQPPQPPSSLGYGVPFQGPVSKFDGPRETNCSS